MGQEALKSGTSDSGVQGFCVYPLNGRGKEDYEAMEAGCAGIWGSLYIYIYIYIHTPVLLGSKAVLLVE